MKRTTILFVFILASMGVFAQKGKVTAALNFKDTGKLDKAVEAINEAIDANNPKAVEGSLNWPRTWEVRGEIYQAIFQSKDAAVKKLSDDPLTVAYESYKKAIALDEKNRFGNSIKIKLTLLIGDLTNQAVTAFNEEKYSQALTSFEQILDIEQTPVYKGVENSIDTVIIFNAGLAAYNAENYDKAINYYKKAAEYKYNGARTYQLISSSYLAKKDTTGALATLKDGFSSYPDNSAILVDMINIYLNANKVDEAMKYLELAINQDPQNSSFYFAQGTLYDKLEKPEDAAKSYEKAIELKPDYFDAYYNLGALYYNKGVKQVDVANAVPSNQPEKYEEEKAKADAEFAKAVPYMEKAHEINPKDRFTMESLKTLYYRLKMTEKNEAIIEELKNAE
jgi:tetratricopeptide (TPR) repeat protein